MNVGNRAAKGTSYSILRLILDKEAQTEVPIIMGNGIISGAIPGVSLSSFTHRAILTDENVAKSWKRQLSRLLTDKNDLLIILPPGEDTKRLETLNQIWSALLKHKFDRKSILINVGGGVICDVGAFAAATYMRGISFLQMPTTLLCQTDAAIGGKAGINFGGLKNTVGMFAQPLAVVCDIGFLSTLPKRELRSGFAEIIKHALVADKKLFQKLSTTDFKRINEAELAEILRKSCEIKCKIVSSDVNEKGRRKILNFGHTIGHALEMASQKSANPLLHGEAVAIGMIAEAKLSCLASFITLKDLKRIEEIIADANLPVKSSGRFFKEVYSKIERDKKNEGDRVKWVLLNGIGKAVFDIEQPASLIVKAIEYVLQ